MVARSAKAGFLLRHALVILLSLVICGGGARAEPAKDAMSFVDSVVSQAVAMLRDTRLTDHDREQKFNALLHTNFDIPRISRFVLGRYWNATDAEQQRAFEQLFERWTVRLYSARFKEYGGETIKVTGARTEGDTGTTVASEIIHPDGSPPLKVDWRVRHDGDGFKIIDVNVEGVSLALTQREEFTAVIARNGGTIDGLNKMLQDKLSGDAVAEGG
jgi:phospholipid transport system substrate-binding protein